MTEKHTHKAVQQVKNQTRDELENWTGLLHNAAHRMDEASCYRATTALGGRQPPQQIRTQCRSVGSHIAQAWFTSRNTPLNHIPSPEEFFSVCHC